MPKVHEFNGYLHSVELLHETAEATAYPFSLPALRGWDRLLFDERVTFLVGENGSGKSTLIEAIAIAWGFNAEGGRKNFNFSTRASHSELHDSLRLVRAPRRCRDGYFLRAESYFNVATQVEELGVTGYGDAKLHELSHGQAFMALMKNRFRGKGLYVLDEPEAALSPTRQLEFLGRMHDLIGDQSQFIIATHSPIILAYPNARIYELSEHGIAQVEYDELEHVGVTRNFLNNREKYLEIILGDDDE